MKRELDGRLLLKVLSLKDNFKVAYSIDQSTRSNSSSLLLWGSSLRFKNLEAIDIGFQPLSVSCSSGGTRGITFYAGFEFRVVVSVFSVVCDTCFYSIKMAVQVYLVDLRKECLKWWPTNERSFFSLVGG